MRDVHEDIKREIAERGGLDWISMSEMFDVARSCGAEDPRGTAIDIAVEGADAGSLVVGDYMNGRGFMGWSERGDSLRCKIVAALAHNPVGDPLFGESTVMIHIL